MLECVTDAVDVSRLFDIAFVLATALMEVTDPVRIIILVDVADVSSLLALVDVTDAVDVNSLPPDFVVSLVCINDVRCVSTLLDTVLVDINEDGVDNSSLTDVALVFFIVLIEVIDSVSISILIEVADVGSILDTALV